MKAKKKPCKECPFRKDSVKGYLGELSLQPEKFLQQIEGPNSYPCHSSVNWHDMPSDKEIDKAPRCVGSLQFMNNSAMLSRHEEVKALQKQVGKNSEIMAYKFTFIQYHSEPK